MSEDQLLQIHPLDNVAVAIRDCPKEAVCTVSGQHLVIGQAIPKGHKIALTSLRPGDRILKYGHLIGLATDSIDAGDWIHNHNMRGSLQGLTSFSYTVPEIRPPETHISDTESFLGYQRKNGAVGIRNELWIVTTVGCVNGLAETLARRFSEELGIDSGIDNVLAMTHPYGCSEGAEDYRRTQELLCALIRHPNAGGVLVLSLGCEDNCIGTLRPVLGKVDPQRVRFLVAQDHEDEIETGLVELRKLAGYVRGFKRSPVGIEHLRIGLECGGSDAFSGLTANPAVGACIDRIVAAGGSAVLSEVPEMFGAESLLFRRCADKDVFTRCLDMINGYRQYFIDHGEPLDDNPSPGNKAGGITTLEEKSLGCIQKGGTGIITDILGYGQEVTRSGLSLAVGPGNDIVSVSALAANGVQMILFTTGRGTPLGAPVPVVKISSNSDLARRKSNWIDFDAGPIVEGISLEKQARPLFELILKIASGQPTRNEQNGYRHFLPFKSGVIE